MGAQPQRSNGLVVTPNFIRAVRESGYVSLSTALAELIDNAVEAAATEVRVMIERPSSGRWPKIQVEDNGSGMNKSQLAACLRFGGSSRFDARESFGRFGMGLPAASLSQARRVEVTAWQRGRTVGTVALDIDEIVAGSPIDLEPRPGATESRSSGCSVAWYTCDRVEYRRLAWLERVLRQDFGRIYRRYLRAGLTITVNEKPVAVVDPMLLEANVMGSSAELVFEPLRYEMTTVGGRSAPVTVRFAMLPVHAWHHLDNVTKRRIGIVGQGGVSILRSGREISNGWHLMGNKRKENYDDWWRCEVEFEPVLDEHFGITVNKQGIRPSAALRYALEPELESIARILNARVRRAFEEAKIQSAAAASCRIAAAADSDLPAMLSAETRSLNYRITADQVRGEAIFTSALAYGTLHVRLNVDHPAYDALYQSLQSMGDGAAKLRTALDLLILAFARSTMMMNERGTSCDSLAELWSLTYRRMLQRS